MFTTVAKLRASSAMQTRVNTVVNYLNRTHPSGSQPLDEKFPIYVIGNSNSVDDVEWVFDAKTTHAAWPDMERAVLEVFGHRTRPEHITYVQDILNKGKAKAIVELNEKYQLAANKVNGVGTAAVAEAAPQTPVETAPAETAQAKPETPAADALPEVPNYAMLGAVLVALGKVVAAKSKSTADAVAYSKTPTGSRVFAEFITEQGVDASEARLFLKEKGDSIFAVVAL